MRAFLFVCQNIWEVSLRMKELKERIKELEKKLEVRSWEFGVRRKKDSSCKLQAKNLRLET